APGCLRSSRRRRRAARPAPPAAALPPEPGGCPAPRGQTTGRQAFLALVSTMRPHCCRGRSPRVRGPSFAAPRGEAPGGPAARAQVSAALARRDEGSQVGPGPRPHLVGVGVPSCAPMWHPLTLVSEPVNDSTLMFEMRATS
ncbi:unnamed protein product, partial [Prorocentrum cordatum]